MKKLITTIAQIAPIPMDIKKNLESMSTAIEQAKQEGSDLIVFPELCVSGYLLGDRFEYDDFIKELQDANEKIVGMSKGITIVWGNIVCDTTKKNEDGRLRKYNAALIASNGHYLSNGVLTGFMPKTHLPKYRFFDDARHFYPADKLAQEMGLSDEAFFKPFIITTSQSLYRVALTVCEDMWEDDYSVSLSSLYKKQNVDLLVDISASPWTLGKWHARETMLKKRVVDVAAPILYVNCVGIQNNAKNIIWFDGASTLITSEGVFVWQADLHVESVTTFDIFGAVTPIYYNKKTEIEELYESLTHALYAFYKDFNKVVIGLSGGVDSALMLSLLCEVLPKEKILAINMPTSFNSKTTQTLAKQCAQVLGVEYIVVPIQTLYEEQLAILSNNSAIPVTTLTKENIQARIRGHQLATFAAHHGGVFTNNGNKTEVALNYFTLYGDAAGCSAFLSDLWKGQVYELARYINTKNNIECIPEGILTIVPSAELSDNQNVDEGKGDPIYYEYHDALLRAFSEWRIGITDILKKYNDGELEKYLGLNVGVIKKYFRTDIDFIVNLEWAWNAYNTEYKRVQLPPVFLTSRRAFGFDRRDTIAPPFISKEYNLHKQQILDNPNHYT